MKSRVNVINILKISITKALLRAYLFWESLKFVFIEVQTTFMQEYETLFVGFPVCHKKLYLHINLSSCTSKGVELHRFKYKIFQDISTVV